MGNAVEIKALFFALIGGSPGAEIVFLNQNLAVRSSSVLRDFNAHFLGTLTPRLFDFVDEPRDRLRSVEFQDDVLDGIGARSSNAWLPGWTVRRADAQRGEPDLRMSRKPSRTRRYRSRWQRDRSQLHRLRAVACEGAEYPSSPAKPT